jgi:hypothetical protein
MRNWFSLVKRHRPKPASSICKKCGSDSLKRRITTYPVHLTGKLAGKRIDVYRVELDQCRKCGHLLPTPEGRAKVRRCVKRGREFFINNLRSPGEQP